MPALNIVGPRVRRARQNLEPPLTQQLLAVRLQALGWRIGRGGVAKIEAQVRRVTDSELRLLTLALKVTPAWLLSLDNA